MKRVLVIAWLFIISSISAQSINQFDEEGNRHGIWEKNFDGTNVKRYEGKFNHGKEIGEFKFYKNIKGKAVLSATRQFNDSTDTAEVTFYTSKGNVISKGKMRGKTYIGIWKYYQKDSDKLLSLEHYNNQGLLDGKRVVYYKNDKIAEETNYTDGALDGRAINYTLNGTVLKSLMYVKGLLHGEAKFYNPKGDLLVEGQYKNDKKHGIWKYFENGKAKDSIDFTVKGKYNSQKKAP